MINKISRTVIKKKSRKIFCDTKIVRLSDQVLIQEFLGEGDEGRSLFSSEPQNNISENDT